ncbi:MAG: FtsQ-type POTRA domain-containing protein [Firmicutes bacterium]|nr:FtsQ-type POTRA domain-containing protein [Bacillota bacterium]
MGSQTLDKRRIEDRPLWKLLLGLAFFLLSAASFYLLLHSTFFSVREVEVNGLKNIKPTEVSRLAGVRMGSNIFLLKEKDIAERVVLHPAIESCRVTRRLPATVEINVVERTPLALLPDQTGFMVVDRDGRLLYRVGSLVETNLPVITGVTASQEVFPGDFIGNSSLERFLPVMQKFSPSLTRDIAEIGLKSDEAISIYTLEKVEIKVGSLEHLDGHLPVLETIVNQEIKRLSDKPIEYIDMSFNGTPVIKFKQSN